LVDTPDIGSGAARCESMSLSALIKAEDFSPVLFFEIMEEDPQPFYLK